MIEWFLDNQWLIYLIIGTVGVKIGWALHEAWTIWIIREHPERMEVAIKISKAVNQMTEEEIGELSDKLKRAGDNPEELVQSGIEMSIERVGSMLYAYAKDTGQFLAQAPTLPELIKNTELRYPGKKFFGTIANDNSAKELAQ